MGNGDRGARFQGRSGEQERQQLERFRIEFVERLYNGAPRWYSSRWRRHIDAVDGDENGVLNREPGVISKLRQAHHPGLLLPRERTEYLGTCTNPTCEARVQGIFTHAVLQRLEQERGDTLWRELRRALGALAKGDADALRDTCETCGQKAFVFPVEPVSNKWIYVLKEDGDQLAHYCEVGVQEPGGGLVYTRLRDGQYDDRSGQLFEGYLNLLPDPEAYTWHFFLSPVRLGAEALALLLEAPSRDESIAEARNDADPDEAGVPVLDDQQPWATTVRRSFRARPGRFEVVPLVDPFTWAAQLVDFDYLSILAAQHKLARDADEQSKAFIASVLQQSMGRRKVSDNPPEWEVDTWDVADDTIDVPQGASGENIAEAWSERYRDAVEYLTKETNKACDRLIFLLRYSLAHRIVELGCQEHGQAFGFLSHGLVHWAHLLRELSACEEGRRFLTWLTSEAEGADEALHPASRIPIRNVLEGEALGDESEVVEEVGQGILVTIYGALAPNIVSREDEPADAVVRHLANIDVQASSLQGKDLQAGRDLALNVSSGLVDRYLERLPQTSDYETAHRRAVATTWSERLTMFSHLSQFDKALTLLLSFKAYTEGDRRHESEYARFGRQQSQVQAPIKVAEFLAANTRKVLKARLSGTHQQIMDTIDQQGVRAVGRLSATEYEIYISSRSVQAYRYLGTGVRILAGPVGLVLGGIEMISQSMQTIDAWEASNPGAAVGHGFQAAAGVLVIAVAAAECTALLTGAAVAAWAGPVGWIAAGLMLLGSIIIAVWSKNDLEQFAQHCFLGPDYGTGDWDDETGKVWMAGRPWPALRYESARQSRRESRDRWNRQRIALLRLISGFKTWIGPPTFCGGYIYPTQLMDTSAFEIKVEVTPQGRTAPKETYHAMCWPSADDYVWIGESPGYGSFISFATGDDGEVQMMEVTAKPRDLPGTLYDYKLRVRLDLDGGQHYYLPDGNRYLENSTTEPGIYSEKGSDEVR